MNRRAFLILLLLTCGVLLMGCADLGAGKQSLRQVLFAKRVPVKQEVKPPVAVWLEQTVR